MGEESLEKLNGAIEKARACLESGDYEDALFLLAEPKQHNPDSKDISELLTIAEVFFAATKSTCSCRETTHRKVYDWYKILKVEENDKIDVIRKRYRQLALLLHPDKNKHHKAETAFKFVSEAYACLSDKRKQAQYSIDRLKSQCRKCSHKVQAAAFKVNSEQRNVKKGNFFVEKAFEEQTDEERLKMFRERARARVHAATQAQRDRSASNKDVSQATSNMSQPRRYDKRELPTFQGSENQFPNYPHRRVPMDIKRPEVPAFGNVKENSTTYASYKNVPTTEGRSHSKNEKLASPIYEEGKKVAFPELKRSLFSKNLKDALKSRHVFSKEPHKAPRNLDTLIQKLQTESGQSSHGSFRFSDIWRKYKLEDGKSSKGSSWNNKINSEVSDNEDESDESLDGVDKASHILDINKVHYKKLLSKKSQEAFMIGNNTRNSLSGEEIEKSEELLKTLEHLRQEAKDVAATLERLRKSVRSEEDQAQSFDCDKFPAVSG